ncbi:MAG: hypothetical protein AB7S75_17645 [Desulfococcaceae bacterium]
MKAAFFVTFAQARISEKRMFMPNHFQSSGTAFFNREKHEEHEKTAFGMLMF